MTKRWLTVFVVLALAGCGRTTTPGLRIEKNATDSMHPADDNSQTVKELGNNAEIVTGVPATTTKEDGSGAATEDPKDKPGAVAVKMEY